MRPIRYAVAAILLLPLASPAMAEDSATPDALIGQLLPQKKHQEVCYAGSFAKERLEVEDWSNPKTVPVPGLFQFGKQVTRPEPRKRPGQKVTTLTLSLAYDDRKADYDWIYNFVLMARLDGWRSRLYAAGECPWHDKDHPIDGSQETIKANTTMLSCYIDCDGGGMEVERVASSGDIVLRFHSSSGGLRMSAGCSEGASFRVGTASDDDQIEFRLKKANAAACRPLTQWLNRQ